MAFSVTYDGNGSTGGGVPVDPKVYNTGQTVTLLGNINNLVKAGTTTFIYWNTDPNGAGIYYGWPGDTTLVMGAAAITLYAQWCITDGLKSGGVTGHYSFSYDSTLQKTAANPNGIEPDRTNLLINACENDHGIMAGWFGGGVSLGPMTVYVMRTTGGAKMNGSTVRLMCGSGNTTLMRYLMVSEVTEQFMDAQRLGWFAKRWCR